MVFRLQNEKREKIIFAFAVIISAILLLAGCTSKVEKTSSKSGEGKETIVQKADLVTDDKKSQIEKTQDKINIVIADGTYSDKVTYDYHDGGHETIDIKVSVKDDIVTGASITGNNPDKTSEKFINGVNAALPDLVVGKRIDELNLPSQISGSSLTTAAFKKYVQDIIEKY